MDEGPNEHRHGRGRPVCRAMYDVWMGTDGGWVKIWVGGGGWVAGVQELDAV